MYYNNDIKNVFLRCDIFISIYSTFPNTCHVECTGDDTGGINHHNVTNTYPTTPHTPFLQWRVIILRRHLLHQQRSQIRINLCQQGRPKRHVIILRRHLLHQKRSQIQICL